jgi:hypothetical protein
MPVGLMIRDCSSPSCARNGCAVRSALQSSFWPASPASSTASGACSCSLPSLQDTLQPFLINLFGPVPVLSAVFAGPPYGIGMLTAG